MPIPRINNVAQGFIPAGLERFTNCPKVEHPEKPDARYQE